MFKSARAAQSDKDVDGGKSFEARPVAAKADGAFRAGLGPSAEDLRRAVGETSPVGAKLADQIAPDAHADVVEDPVPPVDEETLRAEGFEAGRKAAELSLGAELDAARALIAKLQTAFGDQLDIDGELIAPDLSRLALSIAVAIAGELPTHLPETISVRVAAALADFKKGRMLPTLHINPADAAFFEADAGRFELVIDEEVQRGDFRLASGDAELIDTIAGRLEAARDWLK